MLHSHLSLYYLLCSFFSISYNNVPIFHFYLYASHSVSAAFYFSSSLLPCKLWIDDMLFFWLFHMSYKFHSVFFLASWGRPLSLASLFSSGILLLLGLFWICSIHFLFFLFVTFRNLFLYIISLSIRLLSLSFSLLSFSQNALLTDI